MFRQETFCPKELFCDIIIQISKQNNTCKNAIRIRTWNMAQHTFSPQISSSNVSRPLYHLNTFGLCITDGSPGNICSKRNIPSRLEGLVFAQQLTCEINISKDEYFPPHLITQGMSKTFVFHVFCLIKIHVNFVSYKLFF